MKILQVIIRILRWFFPSKLDKINRELKKAVIRQEKERLQLKRDIADYVLKNFGFKISKYIPPKGVNTYHLYKLIKEKYKNDIDDLSLILNRDLTWKQ